MKEDRNQKPHFRVTEGALGGLEVFAADGQTTADFFAFIRQHGLTGAALRPLKERSVRVTEDGRAVAG